MRVLHSGYRATQQAQEDQQKGVKPQHRQNLSDFDERLKNGEFDTDKSGVSQSSNVDPSI